MAGAGAAAHLLGRDDEALTRLATALARCREAGDRGGEGSALGALGAAYARMKRFAL